MSERPRWLGPEGRMWEPMKIRLRDRLLVAFRQEDARSWSGLARIGLRCLTRRWAGMAEGSYPVGGGRWDNWNGFCGHTAFTKRRMRQHQHPREAAP
jgi:hypothetical protein